MSFVAILLAWLVLAAVLVLGMVLATKGTLSVLIVCLVLFFVAFGKWGCATH